MLYYTCELSDEASEGSIQESEGSIQEADVTSEHEKQEDLALPEELDTSFEDVPISQSSETGKVTIKFRSKLTKF